MADKPDYEQLFAGAATGFAITDVQGFVIHANNALARIVGRAATEISGANLFAWTHPDDKSRHEGLLAQLLAAEVAGFVIEKRYMRPDGSAVWVRNSVSLMPDDDHPQGKLLSISENIGDRKRAEQVLERQEQMASMGRLTSSIIHEINNPLEAVMNLLYLARLTKDLDESAKYLLQAEEELHRASEITAQGLKFPRQSATPVSVDVADLIQSVLTLFKGKLREAHVHLDLYRNDGPHVICYAGEMRQVFVNLITNAIEAMPAGGELKVRVRPSRDWRDGQAGVRVTIADTGGGISEATRRHMYDAFVTTKGAEGSGLGLWITANIVRKHQGIIHVRSSATQPNRNTGGGTVFSLLFPYRGAQGQAPGFKVAAA